MQRILKLKNCERVGRVGGLLYHSSTLPNDCRPCSIDIIIKRWAKEENCSSLLLYLLVYGRFRKSMYCNAMHEEYRVCLGKNEGSG